MSCAPGPRRALAVRGAVLLLLFCDAGRAADVPTFDGDIGPLFEAKCVACHRGKEAQAGLDLTSRPLMLQGGKSGPAIVIGASANSLLVDKVISGTMPPGEENLDAASIGKIRLWIDKGAPEDAEDLAAASSGGAESLTEHQILPIFQIRCLACHGKRKQEGGLDLRTVASRLKGGKSGPAIVAGDPDASLLIKKIESAEMPPPELQLMYSVRPMTEVELGKVRAWISAGAPEGSPRAKLVVDFNNDPLVTEQDRQFWSFLPPKHPNVPEPRARERVRNPVDGFLLRKLEEKGISYSREAEPRKLLRRAYLDLIGMPPTPSEIEEYLADNRPGAYERVIDWLLASSHYGERWARHWLDLAGHSDSEGFGQHDRPRTFAWRYRDYVIRSFNADKPYSRFLTEQIAGDELGDYASETVTPELIDRLAATGFLRTAADPTDAPERGFIAERMNIIADEIQVLTSSVMGLTVGCARCHDHKYDPIPQRDYYRFSAILQTSFDPYDWVPPKKRVLELTLDEERQAVETFNAPLKEKIAQLEQSLATQEKPYRERLLEERLTELPKDVRADLRSVMDTEEEKRTEVQGYLATRFRKILDISAKQLTSRYPELKGRTDPVQKELNQTRRKLKPEPHIRVLTDMGGEPSSSYLLKRGDPLTPGELVEPGVPSVLNVGLEPFEIIKPWAGAQTSGRRLALARWLTQPNHPLTSRVWVNQMWMRHFGRGLVASPSNFGRSGMAPSHPELLDWLATEFVRSGWSIKRMHRLMMTSAAYRQTSRVGKAASSRDPENVLLSRMPLRRMDAEVLYDSILRAAGSIDPAPFGPASALEIQDNKEVVAKAAQRGYRRSIYTTQRMQAPVTFLEAFDMPRMTPNCIERRTSTVATQALEMLNGSVTWKHARYMAGRVIDETGPDPREQVESVYLRALSRGPDKTEMDDSLAALDEFGRMWSERLRSDREPAPTKWQARWLGLATFCHTILNSAEFSFID